MYSEISVLGNGGASGNNVSIRVHSGYLPGPYIKFTGATVPIVPAGTIVENVSLKIPEGLHGLAFFCMAPGPHQGGSGKVAYIDQNPRYSTSVLLSWWDDGKLIVKPSEKMSASELARFNPFTHSATDVTVVNTERKIVYTFSGLPYVNENMLDQTWTYKSVSMDDLLRYITKQLTLDELDDRAGLEKQANHDLLRLKERIAELEDWNEAAVAARNNLKAKLMRSNKLYLLLKRLPEKFLPKMFCGFMEAMDSFHQQPTT